MRELSPGQVFAGYVIQRRLGAGGMGAVYLARHPNLPMLIALKLLESADDDSRDRFLSEAEHIAQLNHPNIVTVYDRGSEGDQLWISMQYMDGGDAATAVRACGALPAGRAVRIIAEAAKGLDFAHAHGVLHRDVKPANILLGRPAGGQDERVVLADFGIAKALEDTRGLTGKWMMQRASFGYTAPERFDSFPAVDARADVYSLGCTFYHLITGSPPYSGTATQLMQAHSAAPIPQPSRVPAARDTGLPSAMDSVIEQAMAKDPNDRPPSCRALAAAARQALDSAAPTQATDATGTRSGPPVTRPTRARHTRKPVPAPSLPPSAPPPDMVSDQPVAHTSTSTNRADGFSIRCRRLVAAAQQALRSRPATPWWRRRSTAAIAVVLLVLGVGVAVKYTIWPQPESGGSEKTLTITKPGETAELAFSGTVGKRVFVEVPSSTLPSGCFLSLRDPVRKEIANGCIHSDGSGSINTTTLPASGEYAVVLRLSSDATGEATVRVIDVVDQDATISPDGTPVTSRIDTPGAASRFRFSGTAGQKVFVEVASSTLPSGCSPLSLRDPVRKEIANGCIHSDGSGSINTTTLPVDGEYTLIIDPEYTDRIRNGTGESDVRLFTVVDQDATISPDGTPVTSRIDTPGGVSRFRFAGTAGQKVSVDVASSTLPSGCSPLSLRDPAGKEIANGCIRSDGSGSINTTTLPVDGEYTLIIDPEYTDRIRNGTGESQVRLYTR